MKKRIPLLCAGLLAAGSAFAIHFNADQQVPDTLFMGKDTLLAVDNMLSKVCYEGASDSLLFDTLTACKPADCARGYRAWWQLADSNLHVTRIRSCCYGQDSLQADLQRVFPRQYTDGKVFADWTSGTYRFNKGKVLLPAEDRNEALYEKEVELSVIKGRLVEIQEFDNSRTRISAYTHDKDSLYAYLYPRIDWSKADDGFVIALVSADENGRVDSVRIVKSLNADIDRQVETLLRGIPAWDILYKRGEFMRGTTVLKIFFNEQKRRQFVK